MPFGRIIVDILPYFSVVRTTSYNMVVIGHLPQLSIENTRCPCHSCDGGFILTDNANNILCRSNTWHHLQQNMHMIRHNNPIMNFSIIIKGFYA